MMHELLAHLYSLLYIYIMLLNSQSAIKNLLSQIGVTRNYFEYFFAPSSVHKTCLRN